MELWKHPKMAETLALKALLLTSSAILSIKTECSRSPLSSLFSILIKFKEPPGSSGYSSDNAGPACQ